MYTLRCPRCGMLMHKVKAVTEQTKKVGLTQLAYHMFSEHTLDQLNALLEYTGGLIVSGQMSLEQLMAVNAPRCPGCKGDNPPDSYRYVRLGDGRTSLCCSDKCLAAVQQ